MAKKGEDLSAKGLISYAFDVIYVTWATHVLTALISGWFWYLYLSVRLSPCPPFTFWVTDKAWECMLQIPIYAIYRAASFAIPYIFPPTQAATAPISVGGGPKGSKEEKKESLSRRQEKLKEKAKRGPIRMTP